MTGEPDAFSTKDIMDTIIRLTCRETEVLQLLARGCTEHPADCKQQVSQYHERRERRH
jgi:FixJ family two-component response regulator